MDPLPAPPAAIAGLQQLIDLETLATCLGMPVATVYDWLDARVRPRRAVPPAAHVVVCEPNVRAPSQIRGVRRIGRLRARAGRATVGRISGSSTR